MSLSASAIRMMAEKGLSASDIADIAEANEPQRSSAAVRQKRYRDNKRNERDVTRDVTGSPKEYISNPSRLDAKASCPALSDRVVEAWNDGPGKNGAAKARSLDANRRKLLSLRVREHSEDEVFEAIANLAASDWHCGKNDRGWSANLGWLLKSPENFQKALEMGSASPPRQIGPPAQPKSLAEQILERQAQAA